jgi:NitT/TauT family transport system permease protein
LREVYLPAVTAWALSNLKVAVGFAFTGAIVSEFIASSRGLGYLLSFAQSTYNASLTLALLLLIMVFVFVLFALAGSVEKRLLRGNRFGVLLVCGNVCGRLAPLG